MKKKRLYGGSLKEQLIASLRDRLYYFSMSDGMIRGVIANGTRMVHEMRWNHGLGILETLVLGQAYLGAALMSASLKGHDRLALQIDCSGPIKGLSVEANAFGEVRGYLKQVPIDVESPLESFDLSPFFGAGYLSVTKMLEDSKHPYVGKIMLEHGRLAKDLALYHLKSEQVRTAISLSVLFDREGEVEGAGAMMLQAMPGADEHELARMETAMQRLPSIGKAVGDDKFPRPYLEEGFQAFAPRFTQERGIEFMCHCNEKRISQVLGMLEITELEDMAANGPFPVKIRCHYCNTTFDFSEIRINEILQHRQAGT